MQVVYRPLHENDIALLSRELPALLAGDWSESALRALVTGPHQLRVLQAEGDDSVVGFIEYMKVVDECQLYNIAVLQGWQQRGFGRRLLQAMLDEASAGGLNSCVLEVRESNTPARRLYHSLGFAECGRRKAYYPPLPPAGEREAAVLYSCLLAGGSSPAS